MGTSTQTPFGAVSFEQISGLKSGLLLLFGNLLRKLHDRVPASQVAFCSHCSPQKHVLGPSLVRSVLHMHWGVSYGAVGLGSPPKQFSLL